MLPQNPPHDAMAILMADRQLGAASKLAFWILWRFAGQQPATVIITADWLAAQCGRSPKAARLWLDELATNDLIKIIDRNPRRGSITLDVYNPCPGTREATPDPQARLPLNAPTSAPIAGDVADVADQLAEVSAPKPPRPLVPKKNKEETSYQSTKESKAPKNPMNPMDSMSAAFTAIAAAANLEPADQKERLKQTILAAAGGHLSEWVAGSAANLVVYHGVPIADVDRILCDVHAMRAAGSLRNPGAFLHAKFRQLAKRKAKPWPRHQPQEIDP